jgi:predicted kinase
MNRVTTLHNTLIYLIGVPAVGKYTVAKEIARLTGAKLVDNQVINTPVYSVVGYDGTDAFRFPSSAWKQIEKIQRAVLTLIRDCPPNESFIFTNCLDAKIPGDKAWYRRVERVAKQRRAQFFPVWLTCDAKVIRQRKGGADRKARWKDTDLSNIDRWVNEFEVLKLNHPNGLTLDTSKVSAKETARRILSHVTGSKE